MPPARSRGEWHAPNEIIQLYQIQRRRKSTPGQTEPRRGAAPIASRDLLCIQNALNYMQTRGRRVVYNSYGIRVYMCITASFVKRVEWESARERSRKKSLYCMARFFELLMTFGKSSFWLQGTVQLHSGNFAAIESNFMFPTFYNFWHFIPHNTLIGGGIWFDRRNKKLRKCVRLYITFNQDPSFWFIPSRVIYLWIRFFYSQDQRFSSCPCLQRFIIIWYILSVSRKVRLWWDGVFICRLIGQRVNSIQYSKQ